jgi:hypothetical protein
MSKLFFDQLVVLDDLEGEIKKVAKSKEEKEELWGLVDEMVHHRVLGCVLDALPKDSHQEFLDKFQQAPHDESLLDYLREKVGENIDELIRQEIGALAFELLEEIKAKK